MHNHRDRPMSGYPPHTFGIKSWVSILFVIPILNHPRQRRVTQASWPIFKSSWTTYFPVWEAQLLVFSAILNITSKLELLKLLFEQLLETFGILYTLTSGHTGKVLLSSSKVCQRNTKSDSFFWHFWRLQQPLRRSQIFDFFDDTWN